MRRDHEDSRATRHAPTRTRVRRPRSREQRLGRLCLAVGTARGGPEEVLAARTSIEPMERRCHRPYDHKGIASTMTTYEESRPRENGDGTIGTEPRDHDASGSSLTVPGSASTVDELATIPVGP